MTPTVIAFDPVSRGNIVSRDDPQGFRPTTRDNAKSDKMYQTNPPDWPTIQAIPTPEDRIKLINDYFISISAKRNRADDNVTRRPVSEKKEQSVRKSYGQTRSSTGSLLSAQA